jgi:long-chain fatty acid transport protein
VRKLLLPLIAAPTLALASGYSLPNTNPRDLAMSASAVAAQIDSGAAFALPASLSRLDGSSARLGAGGVVIFETWSDPTGASPDVEIDKKMTPMGSLSVAYGGKVGDRGWGVGLGIQPFGGAVVTWPGDWPGRYRIVEVDRQVFSGVLTGGVEVLPRVRLGGGLVYYYTTETLSQDVWMAGFSSPPGAADGSASIDVNGGALSFDVSAEVQPLKDVPLTIAVDYKHKATQELDGDATFTGIQPGVALVPPLAAVYTNQGASQTLTIPNTLNIGLAYRVTKPLLVTATYTFDRWVVYDQDVFVGDNGSRIAVPRDYSNGYTIRAGAEYDVMPKLQVRAGIQRDVSGLNERYYSPTLPDASSWAGSLGATWKFGGGLALDAAVFYAMMDEVTAEDPNPATPGTGTEPGIYPGPTVVPVTEGTFRGTYDVAAYIFGVSLGWTPGAK